MTTFANERVVTLINYGDVYLNELATSCGAPAGNTDLAGPTFYHFVALTVGANFTVEEVCSTVVFLHF